MNIKNFLLICCFVIVGCSGENENIESGNKQEAESNESTNQYVNAVKLAEEAKKAQEESDANKSEPIEATQ